MFCEECGKKLIRPQALYCPYCGHKVNHEPAVNPAQPAQSTAPAPQTVSPESDAQGVPVAVSMQVSESPIESMPELQPIVPDTVEEAPAEEVPSVPEIPEQEAPAELKHGLERIHAGVVDPCDWYSVVPDTVEETTAEDVSSVPEIPEQEIPAEPMPELEPIVPEPVEEAPAEEVSSVPEISEQETPADPFAVQLEEPEDTMQEMQQFEPEFTTLPASDAETAEEPNIPKPAATDEPSHQEVHTEPEKAPEPAKEEPEEEEYISTASAFTSFELEEIQRNLKKKITPEPLFDKEKLAAELYNNLYENLYENLRENIKREILKELEEERKNSASEKKPGFFKRH